MKKEKTYTLYWLTGETGTVKGINASSAMNNAGIGHGALKAMDFYEEGFSDKWEWHAKDHRWRKKGTI